MRKLRRPRAELFAAVATTAFFTADAEAKREVSVDQPDVFEEDIVPHLKRSFEAHLPAALQAAGIDAGKVHASVIQVNAIEAGTREGKAYSIIIIIGINEPGLAGTPWQSYRIALHVRGTFNKDCLTFTTDDLVEAGLKPDDETGTIAGLEPGAEYVLSCAADDDAIGRQLAEILATAPDFKTAVDRLNLLAKMERYAQKQDPVDPTDQNLVQSFRATFQNAFLRQNENPAVDLKTPVIGVALVCRTYEHGQPSYFQFDIITLDAQDVQPRIIHLDRKFSEQDISISSADSIGLLLNRLTNSGN